MYNTKEHLAEFNVENSIPRPVNILFWILVVSVMLYLVLFVRRLMLNGHQAFQNIDSASVLLFLSFTAYPSIGLFLFRKSKIGGWFISTHYILFAVLAIGFQMNAVLTDSITYNSTARTVFLIQPFLILPSLFLVFNKVTRWRSYFFKKWDKRCYAVVLVSD